MVGWVDLFIRVAYKDIIVNALQYCRQNKGLQIYSYVIMTSHLHLIVSAANQDLADVIRDFKKYTSKKLVSEIKGINESRGEWMLNKFSFEAKRTKRAKDYKVWQDGYHPIELHDPKIQEQKLDYIHENPVISGFVREPEDYLYSSALDYCGGKGLLDIMVLE